MYVFNAHYMFALTKHCAEIGVWGPFGACCQQALAKLFLFGGGRIEYACNLMQRLWPSDRLGYRVQRVHITLFLKALG